MSIIAPTAQQDGLLSELKAVLRKHGGKLSALELLAITSNLVGQLVAMQDQTRVTPDIAMRVVAANLEIGNQTVVEKLIEREPAGSA